jgi:hypothetical protein
MLLFSPSLTSSVQAVPVEINSRATLGGNDFIDWGTLGAAGIEIANPFVAVSNGGISTTVSQGGGLLFERLDQNPGWNGNFAPGAALIFINQDINNNETKTVSLQFSTPVAGAGTQVQTNSPGEFGMTLNVFDSGNNLLGSFNEAGLSTSTADNSAIFLGVRNDTANIDHVTYTVSTPHSLGFAMDQVDLVNGQLTAIPEPGTILLLATSLTGLGIARWRRHCEAVVV